MKRYTILCYSDNRTSGDKPESTEQNKIVLILFLIAGVLLTQGKFPSENRKGKTGFSVSSVYASEITKRSVPPKQSGEPSSDKIGRIINETATLVQQSRIMNSSTCGRPWKLPLTEVQGKIHNVEYRNQPFTNRTGLHLDVETGPQTYTVIHVYPERLIALCPSVFHFRVGETLTVTGSEFFTGQGGMLQNICAAMITKGEEKENVLGVRDPQTGALERQLCCRQICEKNCIGLPPVCGRICTTNCEKRLMKAVLQPLPFGTSRDKEYRTATY